MYILIIAKALPTTKYPLEGIFEYDQAQALVKQGHKVVFAAVDLRSLRRWRKWGAYHVQQEGMDAYSVNIPVGAVGDRLCDFIGKKALSFLYGRICREIGRPDVVHAHFTDMGVIASSLCKKEKLPLVITEHSSKLNHPEISKSLALRAEQAYRTAGRLICVSEALRKNVLHTTGCDSTVVPNIVDLSAFQYSEHTPNDVFRFISVGALISGKGFDILLSSFVKLIETYPQCHLTIVGDGEEKKNLTDFAKQMGISDKICFTGRLPRSEVAQYFAGSDAFVLASRGETFGVVYIEAMACGLPVIATRCGGPEDFVNGSNGLLVPVDDTETLTRAMEFMYNHAADYDHSAIASAVTERFSPQSIAEKLTNIFTDILSN